MNVPMDIDTDAMNVPMGIDTDAMNVPNGYRYRQKLQLNSASPWPTCHADTYDTVISLAQLLPSVSERDIESLVYKTAPTTHAKITPSPRQNMTLRQINQ